MPETTTPDAATLDAFWGLFENRSPEQYLLERERLRQVAHLSVEMLALAPDGFVDQVMRDMRRRDAGALADRLDAVDPTPLSPVAREARETALRVLRLVADPNWAPEMTDKDLRELLNRMVHLGQVEVEVLVGMSIEERSLRGLIFDVESLTLIDVDLPTVLPLILNSDDPEIASRAQALQARISDLQKPSARERELAAQNASRLPA